MEKYIYTFASPSGAPKVKPITLSTKLILHEAEELGVVWQVVPGTEVIKLAFNGKTEYFRHQVSPLNTNTAVYTCSRKNMAKSLLTKAGLSVANGFMVNSDDSKEYISDSYQNLDKPLVVKPQVGSQGDFISLNINSEENLQKVVKDTFSKLIDQKIGLLIEEMFEGTEYRITASRDKVLGVTNRVPANVTGDGVSTIKELIEKKNSDPRREDDFYNTGLKKIPINDETIRSITEQGLTLETVLQKDKLVYVRLNSNLSTGGDSIDFTDKVHPSVKEIALKAINSIPGLALGGLDFMCHDITKQQNEDSYIIVEINTSPGIFMHDKPFIGENRHVAREFIFLIFPELNK